MDTSRWNLNLESAKRRNMLTALLFILFAFGQGEKPADQKVLSERIVYAFSQKDFAAFAALSPGVEEWKQFDPDQTKGLDDAQIQEKITTGNLPRLRRQFDEVMEDARSRGVRIRDIVFNTVKVQRFSEDPAEPVKLEIMFYYDHMSGRFTAQATKIGDAWYLLDFQQDASPFKDMRITGGNTVLKQLGF